MNEQIDLFSYSMPRFKIDKPIRLIELFAGIGSQAKALENLGVNFETYRVVEWDKYCIKSYNAIHHTNFMNCEVTVELTKGLEERWVDACIYLNSEQMKAFHRIMVRDNINRRGRDETVKSAG